MKTNVLKNYQNVLILTEIELNDIIHTVVDEKLKQRGIDEKRKEIDPKTIFNKTEASNFLNMNPQSLIRARNDGRIRGMKIDGREYGYEFQELENYKNKKKSN
jgi:hypothetical protein